MKTKGTQGHRAKSVLLAGGHILDPSAGLHAKADVWIQDGMIRKIGKTGAGASAESLDCTGKVIVPGFMDMHAHFRDPGQEEKETLESGSTAAMHGGFTEVCVMPNTVPAVDNRAAVESVLERTRDFLVAVHPVAAITQDRRGEILTEMAELSEAGAVAFSDDGNPVSNAGVFRRALEYAGMLGKTVIEHSEEKSLSEGGVMHEGLVSTALGMAGISSLSEDVAVARNILIAEYTKTRLHIAHVSTEGSVRLIRDAKARGVKVTAETCPHYLVLTDEAVRGFSSQFKMNPPLRGESDRLALIEGLKDGTIDVIATDHAPHTVDDKDLEFQAAAFGIIGLETAVGIVLTHLVGKGCLTLEQVVEKMAVRPRAILGLPPAALAEGMPANLTLIDTGRVWSADPSTFQSRSRNTPFAGWEFKGASAGVVRNGQIFMKP
jgi:dihydroorotase